MTLEDGFLQDIRENPDDDCPRLAYADWLEEQGQAERAEFIRVGCALARLREGELGRRELWRRENELTAAHKDEWFAAIRRHCPHWECRRGFIDEIHTEAPTLLRHADVLFRQAIRHVRLRARPPDLAALADCPYLAGLTTLDLGDNSGSGCAVDLSALPQRP